MATNNIDLGLLTLQPGSGLFTLQSASCPAPLAITAPVFHVDGAPRSDFRFDSITSERGLPHGGRETILKYITGSEPALELFVAVRSFAESPILRFRLALATPPGAEPCRLTKPGKEEALVYFRLSHGLENAALTEYQLSHFDQVIHSYLPLRLDRSAEDTAALAQDGMRFSGPVAIFHNDRQTVMAAFEHGSDHPQSFLDFQLQPGGLALRAVKGNTYDGQPFHAGQRWESVWFELGLYGGPIEGFLPQYRRFFLEEVSENRASRQPNIYYNSWNYQERRRYFANRPYIESMTAERMLAEIDVAHRLGVDVFVIDTGWYIKTGDWLVNTQRFPEGLREIKRRLDQYGMKLGLWFNPTVAALTSRVFVEHPEWEMTWDGQPRGRHPIWETEVSTGMCLASDYAGDFIEVMARLYSELGVRYFKWDGVGQYGCNSPLHHHGTEANDPAERADCYAYQMGRAMIHIVEQLSKRCPEAIVDFDITESGRFVGLGFLSVGKYFLVNNGPYFQDFDIPRSVKVEPDTINVFFYPGPARPRICRTGARYDELIPSILFLTHYLPDAPRLSQNNSLAALMVGGNGFWGDLPALSEEDITYQGEQIALYRQVAASATRAYPRKQGFAGSSPEIHEKIEPAAAAGLVAFFTVTPGQFTYYTQPLDADRLGDVTGANAWEWAGNRLKITVDLARDDARVVYVLPKA